MTFSPFDWIRRKAAEAVTLGVGDGLRAVTPDGEEVPSSVTDLRAMLAAAVTPRQLPAAEDDEPATKKGRK